MLVKPELMNMSWPRSQKQLWKQTAQEWREQCFTELHVCFFVWIFDFFLHKKVQSNTAIHLCSNREGPPVLHHQSPESLLVPQVPVVMPPAEAAAEFLDLPVAWWTDASRNRQLDAQTSGFEYTGQWSTMSKRVKAGWRKYVPGVVRISRNIYCCHLCFLGRTLPLTNLVCNFDGLLNIVTLWRYTHKLSMMADWMLSRYLDGQMKIGTVDRALQNCSCVQTEFRKCQI